MKQFIRIDERKRIIKGFTEAEEEARDGDILLREDGGDEFELFGHDPGRALSFAPLNSQDPVFLYKFENGCPQYRSAEELGEDIPPVVPEPSVTDVLLETAGDHEYRLCLLELGV